MARHVVDKDSFEFIEGVEKNNAIIEGSLSMGRKEETTVGENSVAIGYNNEATDNAAYAEGSSCVASNVSAHAEGNKCTASGPSSHAEGVETIASAFASHAEGFVTVASGQYQHVQGRYNLIEDEKYAHIVGNGTAGNPSNAHTLDWEGNAWYAGELKSEIGVSVGRKDETDVGIYSLAIGSDVEASGAHSHAEGRRTKATNTNAHAEGFETTASGEASHAEGDTTTASGMGAHAEGLGTIAASNFQHVQGKYNIDDDSGLYAHIVGNGTAVNARSNAYRLDWNGNAEYAGEVKAGQGVNTQWIHSGALGRLNISQKTTDSRYPNTVWFQNDKTYFDMEASDIILWNDGNTGDISLRDYILSLIQSYLS